MPDMNYLNDLVIQVRRDILRQVHKVNSGHPGGSLGCTEFFVALFRAFSDWQAFQGAFQRSVSD